MFPFLRLPPYRQPSREMLVASYQHLLLACVAGLPLCLTPVPSAAGLLVTCAQIWRLRTIRSQSRAVLAPELRASTHCAGYFGTAQRLLLMLIPGLLSGLVFGHLLLQQALMSGALLFGMVTVWQSYKVLLGDPQPW